MYPFIFCASIVLFLKNTDMKQTSDLTFEKNGRIIEFYPVAHDGLKPKYAFRVKDDPALTEKILLPIKSKYRKVLLRNFARCASRLFDCIEEGLVKGFSTVDADAEAKLMIKFNKQFKKKYKEPPLFLVTRVSLNFPRLYIADLINGDTDVQAEAATKERARFLALKSYLT